MIDLHTHTRFSDGTDSPTVLIAKALAAGITTLGITDHDTTAGWAEAKESLPGGMELVLGSEISALTPDGVSVHIVALLFDPAAPALTSLFSHTQDSRNHRMKKMIEKLSTAGYAITWEEVMLELREEGTLGRPHLADAMIKKGYFLNRDEAFSQVLSNNSPYFVSHSAPTPAEIVKLVAAAGGVSIIAHPLASLRGRTLDLTSLAELIEAGLDGVEVDHRDHSDAERKVLREFLHQWRNGSEKQVGVFGSSDYHGNGKLNLLGENTTDPDEWEWLQEIAYQRSQERRVVQR